MSNKKPITISDHKVGQFGRYQLIAPPVDQGPPESLNLRSTEGSFFVSLDLDAQALKELREVLELGQSILDGRVKIK